MAKRRNERNRGLPRWFEALSASLALVAVAPLLAGIALAVRLTSAGPALFRQRRVGRSGEPFVLLKFRTMAATDDVPRQDDPSSTVTAAGDARVTPLGRWLRRTKLDELPELINIARGDMSWVGPRPEVPGYVDLSDPRWAEVLRRRPGLTGPTSLLLRNEEEVLRLGAERTGLEVGDLYRRVLLPFKLEHAAAAERNRSVGSDLATLLATLAALARPSVEPEDVLDGILSAHPPHPVDAVESGD